ncbi:sigma-54-dependent Fis family transcriptional regulator [bacterium]|nr:sigma-54-dependent Fis family transcriptional regulator [bacterium]
MEEWRTILLVSPDQGASEAIAADLAAAHFKVVRASGEAEVSYCLQRTTVFSAAVIDLTLGERGLEVLELMAEKLAGKPILALIPQANLDLAVRALQCGAYDYLLKPLLLEEVAASLSVLFDRPFQQQIDAARRNQWLRERYLQPVNSRVTEMRRQMQLLGLLARTEAPLLLVGESGVGKTFYSRVLHFLSPRRFESLTFFDCRNKSGAEALLDLFGHSRGLFVRQQPGVLVLQECFRLALSVQNRIVAFMAEQEQFTAAGTGKGLRVIGTSVHLPEQAVDSGQASRYFRQAIAGGVIELPPLAQRREDIPQLADLFLSLLAGHFGLERKYLSDGAMQRLSESSWDDNVLGLQRTLIQAVVLSEGVEIEEQAIQTAAVEENGHLLQLNLSSFQLDRVEESLIGQALHHHSGNLSRTASTLGISRGTLYNKIRKYGLENLTKKGESLVG